MATDSGSGKGESPQVHVTIVVSVMLGLLALLTIIAFGFSLLFPGRIGIRFVPRHLFPAPVVIPTERDQRLALEAQQGHALNGANGRMPISQAMRQIAARGAYAFDPVGH